MPKVLCRVVNVCFVQEPPATIANEVLANPVACSMPRMKETLLPDNVFLCLNMVGYMKIELTLFY